MTSHFRNGSGGSALPRPSSSLRESRVSSFRANTSQPQYDILAVGGDNGTPNAQQSARASPRVDEPLRASSHESSKENMAPPDAEEYETQRKRIEELKAELATMRYKMNNDEQERAMVHLQHENELRDVRRKAEEDFTKRQAAEGDTNKAQRQYETVLGELNDLRESSSQDTMALEKRLRESEDEARLVREQLEELSAAKDEAERIHQKRQTDMQTKMTSLETTVGELEQDGQARERAMQQAQDELKEKNKLAGDMEAEILRLKAQTGDADAITVIRRELTDQVQHIRSLESKASKQHAELTHLRQVHKAVEVVEEEKRSLQRKLAAAASIEAELREARIQRQRLEDERLAWTAYLQDAGQANGTMEFDSPEAMARALVEERYNSATLTEKLGEMQPQVIERDEIIKALESDKTELAAQVEKLKSSQTALPLDKARQRTERQRELAVKEAEYLRAQLQAFDIEDEAFETQKIDQQKVERISELEQLLGNYKAEIYSLHSELSAAASSSAVGVAPATLAGSKRAHDANSESEQIGELNRKRRKLADELSREKMAHHLLQKEHEVVQSRLRAVETSSRTRILSLRANPTAENEAIKQSTLEALRGENAQLLAQLQKANPRAAFPVIPASQLAACERQVEEARKDTASAKKSALRLKEVWAAKSQEFKEAIFSTLGWTVTFIPNGKMRVESIFHPSMTDEHENSIVFDGERGTMKVSGGPQSPFAKRIADQIQFWVREKGCIPGFLAALTLEFYEESTRSERS